MKTRLRELREDHDLTQLKCAKIANISKWYFSMTYLNAERKIFILSINNGFLLYVTNVKKTYL